MRHFLQRLLLFILPIGALVLIPLFPLIKSGESFKGLDEVILQDDPYLIGYTYNEQNYQYLKWKTLESKAPVSVISLGSSRVLQFREGMFQPSFYNAGYTIYKINDFLPFLQSLPDGKYPEYLIIGLDQWMFNSNWAEGKADRNKNYWSSSFKEVPTKSNLKSVWKDILQKKYDLNLPKQSDTIDLIGLNAHVNQNGMRNDGSYYYGSQIRKLINDDSAADDYEFSRTLGRINRNSGSFQTGTEVSLDALEELERLLMFCKANEIQLIAFLPPYADVINQKFEEMEGYDFMGQIYTRAKPLFEKHNFELYDFSKLKSFGGKDEEMIDGLHGGEVIYLRMLQKILKEGSRLSEVVDSEALKEDFEERRNEYLVY